ncbi:MAG: peptidoglycan DD-metalloendopeptidase family protein [Gammaproteobacteria bacterium]|nr:peptidoglycan DD-metalloendopeptidase family protein [Gammaproteobacteria bacterium]
MAFSVFSASNKSQETKQQLEQIKGQIKTVQDRLSGQRKEYGSATRQLKNTEQKINSAAKILRATQRQISEQTRSLMTNQTKQKQLQKDLKQHKQLLAQQMQSAYSSGRQQYLKLLLNQEDPEKLGRMLAYYDYLNRARTNSMRQLGDTLVQLAEVKQSIEDSIKKLSVLEKSQLQEQKRLLSLKEQREREVKNLARNIASNDKKLSNLRENEEELESLLRQMQKALREIIKEQNLEGLKKVKGKLTWPIKGRVSLNYGERINRDIRSNGIRISAPEGKEVAAVFHGRVVFSDWLRGFGLLVIIDHGDGYMSLYGNNQSLFKDVGDWVEAGEMISTVGQSGGQASPGLYFEIRHQGKARNPKQWIRS